MQREHRQRPAHRPTVPIPHERKQHGQGQLELVDRHSTVVHVNHFQAVLNGLRTVIPFSPTSVISPSERRAKSGLSAQAVDLMSVTARVTGVAVLTVKDKIVEGIVIMMREKNVILDRSAHNPGHTVSRHADTGRNR